MRSAMYRLALGFSFVLGAASSAHAETAAEKLAKEAKKEAEAATKAVEAAKEDAKADKFAQLMGGKLIQYGVSAGFAFMVSTGSLKGGGKTPYGTQGARQASMAVTGMPYALFVPGYWLPIGDIQRTYCATSFGADEVVAAEAAAAYARKRVVAGLSTAERKRYESGESAMVAFVDGLAKDLWHAPLHGDPCWYTRFGFWLGKPLAYTASAVSHRESGVEQPQVKRSVSPTFAVGAAYVPNANVTLLLGFSHNGISDMEADNGVTREKLRRFVNVVFGFGGNLDLVTALLK